MNTQSNTVNLFGSSLFVSQTDLNQTLDGSLNPSSISVGNLNPSQPVKTDVNKVLVSSLISQTDLDFQTVAYTGILPAPVGNFTKISSVDGNVENSTFTETDITNLQTDITDLQNDKLNIDGTSVMTGNLQVGNNNVTGIINLTALNVYSNINTLSISGLLGQDIGINNNTNLNSNNIQNVNNLQTNEIRATGNSVNLKDDVNMGFYDIININEIKTNGISTNTGPDVTFLSPVNMNSNNITNVNNLQTLEIKSSGASINFQDDLDIGAYDINNCNEIRTNNLSSSTQPAITLNSDLDFQNTHNLLNCPSINGIRPSGGVFSESSNFSLSGVQAEQDVLNTGVSYGSLSIPANSFQPGDAYALKIGGTITCDNNDVFTLRLRSNFGGSSPIFASFVVTVDGGQTNGWWELEAEFIVRAIGAATVASMSTNGAFTYFNSTQVSKGYGVNTVEQTLFDTTVSNILNLTYATSEVSITAFAISQVMLTKLY